MGGIERKYKGKKEFLEGMTVFLSHPLNLLSDEESCFASLE